MHHTCINQGSESIKYSIKEKSWVLVAKWNSPEVPIEFCPKCGERLTTNLKEFKVEVKEVWTQLYKVVAPSKEEAIAMIRSGTIDPETDPEYSHSLHSDTWTIEGCAL